MKLNSLFKYDDTYRDNIYSLFLVDLSKSYSSKVNDDFFKNIPNLDEIKVKDILLKYGIIIDNYFENGQNNFLLYFPNNGVKNALIKDIKNAQKKFSEDDLRILDFSDLIEKLNDNSYFNIYKDTTLINDYDLNLIYNYLFNYNERNIILRDYYNEDEFIL